MDMQTSFLDRLFEEGLLIETGVDGLYGRSGQFEDVIAAFERLIDRTGGADGAEAIRFPPGINRAYFEKSGYMKSFPQARRHRPLLLRLRTRPCQPAENHG